MADPAVSGTRYDRDEGEGGVGCRNRGTETGSRGGARAYIYYIYIYIYIQFAPVPVPQRHQYISLVAVCTSQVRQARVTGHGSVHQQQCAMPGMLNLTPQRLPEHHAPKYLLYDRMILVLYCSVTT